MRFLVFAVAALVAVGPARADLVFEYRMATDQSDPSNGQYLSGGNLNAPLPAGLSALVGTLVSPWQVQPNTDYIVQIALRQTDNVQPAFGSTVGNRMIGWGFRFTYVSGVFYHTTPITNYGIGATANPPGDINTAGTTAGGFSGTPVKADS